jgi:hypothetical protein
MQVLIAVINEFRVDSRHNEHSVCRFHLVQLLTELESMPDAESTVTAMPLNVLVIAERDPLPRCVLPYAPPEPQEFVRQLFGKAFVLSEHSVLSRNRPVGAPLHHQPLGAGQRAPKHTGTQTFIAHAWATSTRRVPAPALFVCPMYWRVTCSGLAAGMNPVRQ